MNEITLQWVQMLKFPLIGIFAGLYGFGGINGKWKRRILAPIILTLGITSISYFWGTYSHFYFLYIPLLVGALTLGYGSNELKTKIIKRAYCGLAYGLSAYPVFYINESISLFVAHVILCIAGSIYLGAFNPLRSARTEETLIGTIVCLLPTFII